MKRTIAIILAFALFMSVNVSVLHVNASGTVWNIPAQFPTISAALASGQVQPGDAIHVWDGVYYDYFYVGIPSIQIIGQSRTGATIHNRLAGYPVAVINASGVAIIGLTFINDYPAVVTGGIYIGIQASQCKIYRNIILNFAWGIYVVSSSNNEIIGNQIDGCNRELPPPPCSAAIYISGAKSTGNKIRGNEIGLAMNNSLGIQIRGNASSNTIAFNNFWTNLWPQEAWVEWGSPNTWDDSALRIGNFWKIGEVPPHVIDSNNIDHFCHAPFDWTLYPWDINRDGRCDIKDLATVAKAYGTQWSQYGWNPLCDISGPTLGVPDGKVDTRDLAYGASHFGWYLT